MHIEHLLHDIRLSHHPKKTNMQLLKQKHEIHLKMSMTEPEMPRGEIFLSSFFDFHSKKFLFLFESRDCIPKGWTRDLPNPMEY